MKDEQISTKLEDRIIIICLIGIFVCLCCYFITETLKTKWESLQKISENGIKIEIRLEKSDE